MQRTKVWWAALTKLERSELYALEHSHAYQVENYPDDMQACGACGVPMIFGCDLCPLCNSRKHELIKKADDLCNAFQSLSRKLSKIISDLKLAGFG